LALSDIWTDTSPFKPGGTYEKWRLPRAFLATRVVTTPGNRANSSSNRTSSLQIATKHAPEETFSVDLGVSEDKMGQNRPRERLFQRTVDSIFRGCDPFPGLPQQTMLKSTLKCGISLFENPIDSVRPSFSLSGFERKWVSLTLEIAGWFLVAHL